MAAAAAAAQNNKDQRPFSRWLVATKQLEDQSERSQSVVKNNLRALLGWLIQQMAFANGAALSVSSVLLV